MPSYLGSSPGVQQPGFPQQPCKIWEMTRAQHRAGSRFLALLTPGAMVIFPCAYRTHFCIYLSFAMRQNTKSTATPQAVNKNDDQAGCKDAWKPLCPHTRPPVPPSHTPTPKPQNGAAQKQGRNTPHVYIPRHRSFPPKTASGPRGHNITTAQQLPAGAPRAAPTHQHLLLLPETQGISQNWVQGRGLSWPHVSPGLVAVPPGSHLPVLLLVPRSRCHRPRRLPTSRCASQSPAFNKATPTLP